MAALVRACGATLAEALVALGVLSLVLVSLFTLVPSGALAVRQAEGRVAAEALAQSLLEEQLARPFTDLEIQGPVELPAVPFGSGLVFEPIVEILAAPGHDPTRLKEVRVTVPWRVQQRSQQVVRSLLVTKLRR